MINYLKQHIKMKKSTSTSASSNNKGTNKTASIAVVSLAVILGLLQATVGLITLTAPHQLTVDYNRDIKNQYQAFSNSLKFAHAFVSRFALAYYLRHAFGLVQLISGLLLIASCHFNNLFHHQANYALATVNLSILGLQLNSGVSYELWAGNLVFCILLVTRLILIRQHQQFGGKKAAGSAIKTRNEAKPKTSTPKKKQN